MDGRGLILNNRLPYTQVQVMRENKDPIKESYKYGKHKRIQETITL